MTATVKQKKLLANDMYMLVVGVMEFCGMDVEVAWWESSGNEGNMAKNHNQVITYLQREMNSRKKRRYEGKASWSLPWPLVRY